MKDAWNRSFSDTHEQHWTNILTKNKSNIDAEIAEAHRRTFRGSDRVSLKKKVWGKGMESQLLDKHKYTRNHWKYQKLKYIKIKRHLKLKKSQNKGSFSHFQIPLYWCLAILFATNIAQTNANNHFFTAEWHSARSAHLKNPAFYFFLCLAQGLDESLENEMTRAPGVNHYRTHKVWICSSVAVIYSGIFVGPSINLELGFRLPKIWTIPKAVP